jgi:hypothetical protein
MLQRPFWRPAIEDAVLFNRKSNHFFCCFLTTIWKNFATAIFLGGCKVTSSANYSDSSTNVLFICLSSARQLKCLRVSKTESYGISRICFEMTRQAQCLHRQLKCLRVSKTESYGISKICFEMTRQATMPSSKAWLCLADEQHISLISRSSESCWRAFAGRRLHVLAI